jgi:putative thioredoxin
MSMDTPILSEGGVAADADLIKNTTTKDFMRDVVDASREVPVLVDFWAPWCGPCRQLTPLLEKAVRAAKGAVKLVKMNIDEHPQVPGRGIDPRCADQDEGRSTVRGASLNRINRSSRG